MLTYCSIYDIVTIRNEHTEKIMERRQFDILCEYVEKRTAPSQRELAKKLNCSVGTVNKVLKELAENGYLTDGRISESGYSALEPYRVKRAIFLAAGVGSRLMPVTLNTPKPLVRVKGQRMIDGLIDMALKIGIEEIIVVRGYFSDQFDQLKYKYPMIKFIENPDYMETNNISSAVCAKYLFSNSYVFESDLILNNDKILKRYHYSSDFLGFYKERSDDWCFEVKNGQIISEQFGGTDCFQMVGISYWNEIDGGKLSYHLQQAYEMPGGKEKYWEQVPLTIFNDQYQVELIECSEEDVIEIDTFRELKAADPAYSMYR